MEDTYKMTVDLNVLGHLGINLYSNIAAVLTEAVADDKYLRVGYLIPA